ncbi:hypothetical protein [Microbacterium paludicola]|uniref:hypothetical protein n=1 Tax=Microbacterium paludicola TaxID=300019 RepID=UPI0031E1155C
MHPIAVAPYLGGMVSRRASLGLVALLVVGLTGCTGAPAPDPSGSPSPAATGFASEDEAFAAAEETYRAYNQATNAVQLDDPESFQGVFDLTVGDYNAHQRETLSQMHAAGWTVSGETRYSRFTTESFDPETQSVVVTVCVDVSDVEVLDVAGNSVVSDERPDRQAARITMEESPTPTFLALAHSERIEDPECAS